MSAMTEGKNIYVLTATCGAAIGTVARISGFLAQRRCYIMEMAQFDDVISGRFYARAVFYTTPGETPSYERLCEEFALTAAEENMTWEIHDTLTRPRVMLLVSKADHCLNDLLYRHRIGDLKMDITAVVSNHSDLEPLARWHGIPYHLLPVTPQNKAEQEAKLLELIESTRTDLVVLARYMQVLSSDLCAKLHGRVINIHHSFLPGFKGANPYRQAHARGVKLIGATAHFVTEDLDEGPIIEQNVIRVDHSHTVDELVALGQDEESRTLTRAVRWFAEDRVLLDGVRTIIFR